MAGNVQLKGCCESKLQTCSIFFLWSLVYGWQRSPLFCVTCVLASSRELFQSPLHFPFQCKQIPSLVLHARNQSSPFGSSYSRTSIIRTSISIRTCFSGPSFLWILIARILWWAAKLFSLKSCDVIITPVWTELVALQIVNPYTFRVHITNAFHWALIGRDFLRFWVKFHEN